LNIRWARSATKHRVSRHHSGYVIEHCGLIYVQTPTAGPAPKVERQVYLGDDPNGRPLEVVAVGLADGDLLVIHAMLLREKYQRQYLEAMKWRR
jgi:hypothetical protein